jgi:Tol biopolymer transport system component
MTPREDRYTHVVLSPSATKALYFIERSPPTPSVPVMGERYLGPIVNDIYVADEKANDVLYVGQIVGHIDQALWYPDDARVLVTTTDIAPTSTKTWQFEASVLPKLEAFSPASAYPYSFSPDGLHLLFNDGTQLRIREISTGEDTLLPFSAYPREAWWSQDSTALAALVSDDTFSSHTVVYNTRSAQVSHLAPALADLARWYMPRAALSPDFTLLAYLAADAPLGAGSRLSLARLCPQQRPLTPPR